MTIRVDPSAAGAPPELTVSSLTVRFSTVTALTEVNLTVRAGEVVALAGRERGREDHADPGHRGRPGTGLRLHPGGRAAGRAGCRAPPRSWGSGWSGRTWPWSRTSTSASNVMLGNERRWHLFSDVALHTEAGRLLAKLGIPLRDTTLPIGALSGGQRQMVAVARAMAHNPRLLLLDEPTASLGMQEAALVERLITRLRAQGTTILLSCHDTELMFRLADRIVVLRHGRVVTEVSAERGAPGRRGGAGLRPGGRLLGAPPAHPAARARPGGWSRPTRPRRLSLILSALGAALGSERLCHPPARRAAARAGRVARHAGGAARRLGAAARSARRAGRSALAAERQLPVIEENMQGRRRLLAGLRQPGPAGEGRQLLVGAGARARRAARRDHRVPRDAGQAPPGRPGPGRALRRVRRERDRAGPAARRGDRAQPAA